MTNTGHDAHASERPPLPQGERDAGQIPGTGSSHGWVGAFSAPEGRNSPGGCSTPHGSRAPESQSSPPRLGRTASEILSRYPSSYIGIERDPAQQSRSGCVYHRRWSRLRCP